MSKRKLTADESVVDVLQFVEDGDDVDDGDAADDLNEIYDDDINNDVGMIKVMMIIPLTVMTGIQKITIREVLERY